MALQNITREALPHVDEGKGAKEVASDDGLSPGALLTGEFGSLRRVGLTLAYRALSAGQIDTVSNILQPMGLDVTAFLLGHLETTHQPHIRAIILQALEEMDTSGISDEDQALYLYVAEVDQSYPCPSLAPVLKHKLSMRGGSSLVDAFEDPTISPFAHFFEDSTSVALILCCSYYGSFLTDCPVYPELRTCSSLWSTAAFLNKRIAGFWTCALTI